MRMEGQEESSNVEDVRGMGGGGGGGFSFGGRSVGIGTLVVALIAGWIFGINPLTLLGLAGGGAPVEQSAPQGPMPKPPADDPQAHFVSQVLRSTETVWSGVFRQAGKTYQPPKLRIFRESFPTACGYGQAAMGPFYCPEDQIVYIDLKFFAHEVGHHVQQQMGIMSQIDAMRERASRTQANALSVRVELQADCFAGVWAKRSQSEMGWRLEPGDIETALNAASRIGDDALQQKSQGTVVPESFTHGTSEQRVGWFKRGFESGSVDRCNTVDG
jgi:predicted metalloprotease